MKYRLLGIVFVSLFIMGCTNTGKGQPNERSDPLEGFNRAMFNINYYYLDPYLLRPVAVFWNNYIPKPIRVGISNFSSNLEEPFTTVNYFVKGEPKQAMGHFNRFFLNTFFGVAGVIDIASLTKAPLLAKNKPYHFGSVLGAYGAGYGPYAVLPGYGPVTIRETGGQLVDNLYPPLYWLVSWPAVGKWLIDGIESRARFLDQDQLLKDSSDPYLMTRESYFQYHDFLVDGGKIIANQSPNSELIQADLAEIDSY